MHRDNPYAAPNAQVESDDSNADAERRRWRSTESHVAAIGLVAHAPAIAYLCALGLMLYVGTQAQTRALAFVPAALLGLLLIFAAHRLRRLKRDGRLILTIFFVIIAAVVFVLPTVPWSYAFLAPPAGALIYLWFGRGAHVLGEEHSHVLAATGRRAVPTAMWGFVVFGVLVSLFLAGVIAVSVREATRSRTDDIRVEE